MIIHPVNYLPGGTVCPRKLQAPHTPQHPLASLLEEKYRSGPWSSVQFVQVIALHASLHLSQHPSLSVTTRNSEPQLGGCTVPPQSTFLHLTLPVLQHVQTLQGLEGCVILSEE